MDWKPPLMEAHVRQVFSLDDQFMAYLPDKDMVVTVQRWSGFRRGLHGFVVSLNERITTERTGTPGQVMDWYRTYADTLAPNVVTEAQARDHLERKTGQRQHICCGNDCTATLPLGRRWCRTCGRPQPAVRVAEQSDQVDDAPLLEFLGTGAR